MGNSKGWIYVCVLLGILLIGSLFVTKGVSAANNSTTMTRVLVGNTPPTIYNVSISPDPVNLNPGMTTMVNCTAKIYDANGWTDVKEINATLFDTAIGTGITNDSNYRYINASCGNSTTACSSISATNASCICQFNVQYFANNGSWQCNVFSADFYNLSSALNSSPTTINSVIGINTPSELDFGNLSITETSVEKVLNITNFGNLPINVSLRGYGGDDSLFQNDLAMLCTVANITNDLQRYSTTSGTIFGSMNNITNLTTSIGNFSLPTRTNDTQFGSDRNQTYWRLQVPSNVSGNCNGTLEFYASLA